MALLTIATGLAAWAGVSGSPSTKSIAAPEPSRAISLSQAPAPGTVTLTVFMGPEVTADEIGELRKELSVNPEVKAFYWMDQQQEYDEMKRLFANQPTIVAIVPPADLPPSFLVILTNPRHAVSVSNQLSTQPGVARVTYPGQPGGPAVIHY